MQYEFSLMIGRGVLHKTQINVVQKAEHELLAVHAFVQRSGWLLRGANNLLNESSRVWYAGGLLSGRIPHGVCQVPSKRGATGVQYHYACRNGGSHGGLHGRQVSPSPPPTPPQGAACSLPHITTITLKSLELQYLFVQTSLHLPLFFQGFDNDPSSTPGQIDKPSYAALAILRSTDGTALLEGGNSEVNALICKAEHCNICGLQAITIPNPMSQIMTF